MARKHRKTQPQKHPKKHEAGKTAPFAVFLVVFCTLLTASGQLLLKIGTQHLTFDIPSLLSNIPFLAGIVLYGLGAIILIVALKYGELSILYPFIALSFIWVMLLSMHFLHEIVTALNWIGVIFILLGVSFIGKGGTIP